MIIAAAAKAATAHLRTIISSKNDIKRHSSIDQIDPFEQAFREAGAAISRKERAA
jgi:hypothetical protein